MLAILVARAGERVARHQDQAPNRREVTIVAREHSVRPRTASRSTQDDLVRITLTSDERPYSFAIDAYRIFKRVGAGQTIVFEFRADQAGTFTFYCNLTSDRGVPGHEGDAGGESEIVHSVKLHSSKYQSCTKFVLGTRQLTEL